MCTDMREEKKTKEKTTLSWKILPVDSSDAVRHKMMTQETNSNKIHFGFDTSY